MEREGEGGDTAVTLIAEGLMLTSFCLDSNQPLLKNWDYSSLSSSYSPPLPAVPPLQEKHSCALQGEG